MRVPNRASKRQGKRLADYRLEGFERRTLLSASVDLSAGLPANWQGHPAIESSANLDLGLVHRNAQGSAFPSGVTPARIRSAYGSDQVTFNGNVTGDGTGQTIAIVVAYDWPTAQNDLAAFDGQFNLPSPPSFSIVNQQGLTTPLPATDPLGAGNATGNWEQEAALDVEWAHASAPGASIVLVEASSDLGNNLFIATSAAARIPGVSVVTMSWSYDETAAETNLDSIFTTPAGHTNVTFIASSGDTGIFGTGANAQTVTPAYPASSPNVVAVGGTTLALAGNNYSGETGWGNSSQSGVIGGSGGGTSSFEPQPAYQRLLDTQDPTFRSYPDVAMNGDPNSGVPVYDSYDFQGGGGGGGGGGSWNPQAQGGTSLATQLFAGIIAMADQGRLINGFGTLDGAKETLPHLYDLPGADFHDVISGNNGDVSSVGFDLVTGRGSPVANLLVPDLASAYIGSYAFTDINFDGIQETPETGIPGVTVNLKSASSSATIQTTTTDQFGLYQFTGFAAGTYYVNFVLPNGYAFSNPGTGNVPTANSTVIKATGNTAAFTVTTLAEYNLANAGAYQQIISINDVTITRAHSGLTPMVFTVTIAPASSTAVSVPYTTVDGTATVANNDYQPTSGTLVFPPGITVETITVEAVGNLVIENDVSYTVVLTPPPGYIGQKTVGVGTILNSNFPVATVSGPAPMTRSATATLTYPFVISLSAPAPFVVNVPYTTFDQSALAGPDYVGITATVSFPAGVLSETINVTVLPGTNRQLDKTFLFELTTPPAPITETVGTPSQATGTILTNSPPAVNADPGEVTESLTGLAYLPFNVDVVPSLNSSFTINYTTADGTAIAGKDYQAQSGVLSFGPGRIQQTVYVPVYRQFIAQQDKTLTLTIFNPSSNIEVINPTVTGTIHYLSLATLPFTARHHAVYLDSLNQRVTVSMKGVGTGDVVFLGTSSNYTNAYEVVLDGTNPLSSATISVPRGRQTVLTNLVVSSAIGVINAKSTNLVGTVAAASSIKTLNLGYIEGATINIGGLGSGAVVTLNFNRVLNSTITSAISIASLTANAYVNTTGAPIYVTAPSVGTVKVKGSFGGTISTTSVHTVSAHTVGSATVPSLFSNSLLLDFDKPVSGLIAS